MNLDLTGIPVHVNNFFYQQYDDVKIIHICTAVIIFTLTICALAYIHYQKTSDYPYKGFASFAIIGFPICGIAALIMIWPLARVYTGNNYISYKTISFTKTDRFDKEQKTDGLDLSYSKVHNSKVNEEFNKAIEKNYGLKAVNTDVIPDSVNREVINKKSNDGVAYIKENKPLSCAFNYDIIKKNNVGQIKTIKMNMIVCSDNGKIQVINSK